MREMKDSGVEWIGLIPTDWNVGRIKYNYYLKGRIGWQGLKADEFIDEGPYLVTGTDFENGKVNWNTCYHISQERYDEAPEIHVNVGDLLITKDGTVGKVAYIDDKPEQVSLNSHLLIMRPLNEKYNNRYLFWVIQSPVFDKYFGLSQNGTIMASLSQEKINDFSFSLPSGKVQKQIVDYLDSKCAKIDSIIEKQQAIIEKLKEYKLSVITETIKYGLNRDGESKDSGKKWIGKIESSYRICKLKSLVDITDGTHDTPEYVDISDDTYPLVTSKCINDGKIDISLANHISESDYIEISKRSNVERNDVIMPMIGTVGNPALVDIEPNFAIKNVALMRTKNDEILGKYIVYLLNSDIILQQFLLLNTGGVQNFISQDKLKNLICIKPSNMNEIVDYLDDKTQTIDKRIKDTSAIMEKLIEYKKSLIY